MKKFMIVLTLVCFFVGSSGTQPDWHAYAKGHVHISATEMAKLIQHNIKKSNTAAAVKKQPVASRSSQKKSPIPAGYSKDDLLWLARIIHAEAKGEPFKGKVAVGAVILNRVEDSTFPETIYEVIHDRPNGTYQFQPVANGKIKNKPDKESIEAAKLAMIGKDPTHGAMYFYNPKISRSQWMANLDTKTEIGNHVFAGS